MQGLVQPKDLNFVGQLRAFDSTSLSFFSLIADKDSLINLFFLLLLLTHLINLKIAITNQIQFGRKMAPFYITITKLLAFGGIAVGSTFIYWRLSKINQVLGTELLDASQALFIQYEKELLRKEGRQSSKEYLNLKVGFKIQLLEERLAVYFHRLLYFNQYQEINSTFIQEVVKPILANYQKEEVFQNTKVIQFLQNQGKFNNPVTSLLISIQLKNAKIKEQNQGYIQDLLDIQNKLITIRFLGLSQSQKQAIDLLYNYLKAKDQSLIRLAEESSAEKHYELGEIQRQDYLSKIQLL